MKHTIPIGTLRESENCPSRLLTIFLLLTLSALWLPEKTFGVGHWTPLTYQPATTNGIGICLLLSDGTVLAEGSDSNWFKLTPDSNGHYVNGTWTSRNSSSWRHHLGSTAVLTNGNVFVSGGENANGTDKVEIYNPVTGLWSVAVDPTSFGNIEDGNAMLLPDGQVLIEPQGPDGPSETFTFNPGNNTFSQTAGAPLHSIKEASWVKLPNDNILVIDSGDYSTGLTSAEMYISSSGIWTNAVTGGTVPNIWPDMSGSGIVSEMGPAFLLPNGKAIFFGGNLVTAVYDNGTWSQGANMTNGLGMKDAPGAMMVNGKILLAVCPQGVNTGANADDNGIAPTSFYEYDYTANNGVGSFSAVPTPPSGISARAVGCSLLDLPDGTVLLSLVETNLLFIYQPDTPPLAAGQPHINSVQWNADGSLHITGTLFNGISEGAAFGDDKQMASNYPLVRFTDGSGNVYYGTTYNWSSTSVQTGDRIVTTEVTVPSAVLDAPAQWSLQVVANGNASDAVTFYSPVWVDFVNYNAFLQLGFFSFPYSTLPQGVSAVASGGTIAIRADAQPSTGHVPVPYNIPNAMTIISVYGPSTIGN